MGEWEGEGEGERKLETEVLFLLKKWLRFWRKWIGGHFFGRKPVCW
jgi:hypothetical protein